MKYTGEVFQRLSKGQFISSNSIDAVTRDIYNDIEENLQAYTDYFNQIDFQLSVGDGFFYFSRKDSKVAISNKLQSLFSWIDYMDFLKAYDSTFGAGTQFRLSQIDVRTTTDLDLKEKLSRLFVDKRSNWDKINALADAMVGMGFAELVNEIEEEYQVTSAFHYLEQIIMCIAIEEEVKDEIPE